MPPDDPLRQPTDEIDPDQTLFFKRRQQHPNLLPLAVLGILVLGGGALLTWAFTRSARQRDDETSPRAAAVENFANRPIVSVAEAKNLENPPIGPAKELAGPIPTIPPAAANPPSPAEAENNNVPPPPADANAPLNFDVNDPTNAAVRAQVLQRIDLMPNLTPASKDKLYASVDHARKMGRVLTFPFAKGETTAHPADIERLKRQVQAAAIKQLLDDPTVVFVVLGYADPKGSDKVNSDISLSRARSVLEALRDKCGFQNVMHAVAMGGSTLFSASDAGKNRVVEIWAVVP